MVFELLAAACAGLFAGAAIYISAVEHPARLACGTALAVTEFGPSYRRATLMQAPLAMLGLIAAMMSWARGGGWRVLMGGVLLGAAVPFTLLVLMPTNRRLLDPALDRESAETRRLLDRWGRFHAVRSVAGAAGFLLLLWQLGARQ